MKRLLRLGARRPGPLGTALLLPTWVMLGLAVVLWVLGIMVVALLAVLVASVRLLLLPLQALLARVRRRRLRVPSTG